MGGAASGRNKRSGTIHRNRSLLRTEHAEADMADDREKISTGPNERPVNETIAGTGPGIPDDALSPGQKGLPQAPSDDHVANAARALDAPTAERDTLPLDGE